MPSKTFYNGTKGKDIVGPDANEKCSIHYWAEHGIVGRGVLLDIWRYANAKGETFDPWEYHSFSYELLEACGRAQGIDIRPEAQGGDILPGDILMIRGGWTSAYRGRSDEERKTAGNRKHLLGTRLDRGGQVLGRMRRMCPGCMIAISLVWVGICLHLRHGQLMKVPFSFIHKGSHCKTDI
jgi:hypothetical protein